MKDERKQWVAGLNVGDEVAYLSGSSAFMMRWVIAKISKITPSGRLNLHNGTIANSDGSIRGEFFRYIQPVTEEIRTEIWRDKAISKIRNELKIERLSNDELKVILKIVTESSLKMEK